MRSYLVDTNHVGAMLDNALGSRQRLLEQADLGFRFGTCVPVLCELEVGLLQTARYSQNRKLLRQLLKPIRIWPFEREDAEYYGKVYAELRSNGRAIMSQVDMFLSALCRRRNLTLLTTDHDFAALPDIRTENWLV